MEDNNNRFNKRIEQYNGKKICINDILYNNYSNNNNYIIIYR